MRALRSTSSLATRARGLVDTLRSQKIHWWGDASGDHVQGPPSAQAIVDIFAGEWASRLPPPYDELRAGDTQLFEDERIRWTLERFGPLDGQSVLDLGPLEGGHTYMALQAGAKRVVAVEGNARHFLKCLVVKDILRMYAADLRLGDFVAMLQSEPDEYDLVLAQGVLYHMVDPVELIALTAARARRLALWTQYYDSEQVARLPTRIRRHFADEPTPAITRGFAHAHHRFNYGVGRKLVGFYGGNQPHANWLSRDDLMGALEHFGWCDIEVGFEKADDPHGPSLSLTAVRG
ncbi:MAG: class I SAM-dependent methyltransferase [Actinomycetota bacterium]|nr:class I SAM-dependent methyltransferase [Actinomycetota bacterium]